MNRKIDKGYVIQEINKGRSVKSLADELDVSPSAISEAYNYADSSIQVAEWAQHLSFRAVKILRQRGVDLTASTVPVQQIQQIVASHKRIKGLGMETVIELDVLVSPRNS